MEAINQVLSGILMPVLLLSAGVLFCVRLRGFYFLHPIRFIKTLAEAGEGSGVSPFRALSQALAGTLGVGNMAGVATAIVAGGPGAILWMWISALCAMSVKYAEVRLAVEHRRKGARGYYGGAMYYIQDLLTPRKSGAFAGTPSKKILPLGTVAGGIFALLCVINSLLTGNIVQMHAAAAVFPSLPPLILGGVVAAVAFVIACGGAGKVSRVTMGLIPLLSGVYLLFSAWILIRGWERLPGVLWEIVSSGLSFRAAAGGAGGFAITRAIRFGVTRGIFSNEAGCGTSPTAHAAASVKSPHHQGCFGIFEVFADTIVLCTVTALVILLSDGASQGLDGIPLTLYAYTVGAGEWAGRCIGVSVILFAFATVICQTEYGKVAIGYLTQRPGPRRVYVAVCAAATLLGTVIAPGMMWQWADLTVSLMTAVNVICLCIYWGPASLRLQSMGKRKRARDSVCRSHPNPCSKKFLGVSGRMSRLNAQF